MKRKWLIIVIAILLSPILFILGLILLQKPFMSLAVNGKVVAVVRQPFFRPNWSYGSADFYAGGKKIFSLPENYLLDGGPIFIYPFADGQRFLCIYDDDAAVLVFVVDFNTGSTKTVGSREWPTNDYLRKYLTERAPHVVMETKGVVRLPNYTELQEVSSNVTLLSVSQFRTASFPTLDLGLFRRYWKKDEILDELNTNRQSVWP